MKKLIVIPARGGSKGIPKKNIYPLNNKPLLEYTIEIALDADLTDSQLVVSTDSSEIMEIAGKYKGIYIVERPADISNDTAKTEDALIHSLDYMENKLDCRFDAVITLQPTSPFRKIDTLKQFVSEYELNYPEFDAMLSLNEYKSDLWIYDDSDGFKRLFPDAPRRRQDRKPVYVENSAYYITDSGSLRTTGSILGKHVKGFVINDDESFDINEPIDIKIAESMIKKESF